MSMSLMDLAAPLGKLRKKTCISSCYTPKNGRMFSKKATSSNGKDHLPTINFSGNIVSFQGWKGSEVRMSTVQFGLFVF